MADGTPPPNWQFWVLVFLDVLRLATEHIDKIHPS